MTTENPNTHRACTVCGAAFGGDYPMGIRYETVEHCCFGCATDAPSISLLREALRSLLNNQPHGHRFARAMERDCSCRWCKAHRVLGFDAWPGAPPVVPRVLHIDLGHAPKMNDDERQCGYCERVYHESEVADGICYDCRGYNADGSEKDEPGRPTP